MLLIHLDYLTRRSSTVSPPCRRRGRRLWIMPDRPPLLITLRLHLGRGMADRPSLPALWQARRGLLLILRLRLRRRMSDRPSLPALRQAGRGLLLERRPHRPARFHTNARGRADQSHSARRGRARHDSLPPSSAFHVHRAVCSRCAKGS